MMLATITRCPEFALEEPEAKELGKAVKMVADCYPTKFDPKIAAWTNLALVAGTLYGGRLMQIRRRKRGGNAQRVDAHENAHQTPDGYAAEFFN